MTVRHPPESWFWSHDIDPEHIDDVMMPGFCLVRLSSYGAGSRRRFAAVAFKAPGPERSYVTDLDAAAADAYLRQNDVRLVAITAGIDDSQPRFSLLVEKGPGPRTRLHTDLDEAGVQKLLDGRHGIVDFITYRVAGVRKYAVILEERPEPSWFFTQVTARDLDAKLAALDATLLRSRAYVAEGGQRWFAAVALLISQQRRMPNIWIAITLILSISMPRKTNEAFDLRWSCMKRRFWRMSEAGGAASEIRRRGKTFPYEKLSLMTASETKRALPLVSDVVLPARNLAFHRPVPAHTYCGSWL